jgi:dTDP-4-amino-4,6-dideoxygalactose transaminase
VVKKGYFMSDHFIPFNRPYMTGKELFYIAEAHFNGRLSGDGPFTAKCHSWFEKALGSQRVLLTHSCTAALELSALLIDTKPGDEIIMPSFTFVSTANAFALRGGVPVFCDIRGDTLNIDEKLIEEAITEKTKALAVVHYAGVGCEMDTILAVAAKHNLLVIEDAAQAFLASYRGRRLGTLGDLGTLSFHETKNVISGEGGALIVNKPNLIKQAEIIREKGTDRTSFFRGEVEKYTWQRVGSSFLPGELIAAFLYAQLEEAYSINQKRMQLWENYHALLEPLEDRGLLRRPIIPAHCEQNAHMYYIILSPDINREKVIEHLKKNSILAVFHYIPLHSSPGGMAFGRASGQLKVTDDLSARLLRLPMYIGLTMSEQSRVVTALNQL